MPVKIEAYHSNTINFYSTAGTNSLIANKPATSLKFKRLLNSQIFQTHSIKMHSSNIHRKFFYLQLFEVPLLIHENNEFICIMLYTWKKNVFAN